MNWDKRTNILVTALEGGSNYWYYIPFLILRHTHHFPNDGRTFAEQMIEVTKDGLKTEVHDYEEGEGEFLGNFSKESVFKGEKLLKEDYPEVWANLEEENYDAEDSDIWFQYCVMGEILFG